MEPNKGEFNETYINQLKGIVKEAANFGIYSILDMHQDVLSEKFCGEGVPAWAADDLLHYEQPNYQLMTLMSKIFNVKFPWPLGAPFPDKVAFDGFPTRTQCAQYDWGSYYLSLACATAFGNLYTNVNGLLDAWAGFWGYVADNFKDIPSVLAYELINEPFTGNVFNNPWLIAPGFGTYFGILPAYDKLVEGIRKHDDKTIVIFDGATWDDYAPEFTRAPGGDKEASRSVLGFHYYEPPQFPGGMDFYFQTRVRDADRMGVGVMLTEFERPMPFGKSSKMGGSGWVVTVPDLRSRAEREAANHTDPFTATTRTADAYMISWSTWEYKTFCKETSITYNDTLWNSQSGAWGSCKTGVGDHNFLFDNDGNQIDGTSRKLARTYARKIAGHGLYMHFDPQSTYFQVAFEIDISISAPTEIFAHQRLLYPNGMSIDIKPADSLSWVMLSSNIIGFFPNAGTKMGQEISITIMDLLNTTTKTILPHPPDFQKKFQKQNSHSSRSYPYTGYHLRHSFVWSFVLYTYSLAKEALRTTFLSFWNGNIFHIH